jgi:pimeloyl-ACP methyl ester carboxylesterase
MIAAMPAVFLHGVPCTPVMWEPLGPHLRRPDLVFLALPGFGSPLPPGFACTKEAYLDWFLSEIDRLAGPLDLVGHDWGAIFVLRAAAVRRARVRTWAAGNASIDPDYVWHRLAQAWQTPGRGEELMERMVPARVMETLIAEGMPEPQARREAGGVDATMKAAILSLYRSALDVGEAWYRQTPHERGLVFWGEDDPYVPVRFADRLATRTGARLLRLPATGHWLPQQRPEELGRALDALWSDAPA